MPATNAPGQIYCGLIHDSIANIESLSFAALAGMASMQPVPVDASRQSVTEVHFKPFDSSDYLFANPNNIGQTVYGTFMVIVAICFQANSVIFHTDAISHLETVGGILASGDDIDSTTLSDTVPQDFLRPHVNAIPTFLSGAAVEQEMTVYRGLSSRSSGRGGGHGSSQPRFANVATDGVYSDPSSTGFVEVLTSSIPGALATAGLALAANRANAQILRAVG